MTDTHTDKPDETPIAFRLAQLAHEASRDHDMARMKDILVHNIALGLSAERPNERLVLGDSGLAWKCASMIYARAQDDWFDEGRCHIAPMVIAAALDTGTQDVAAAVAAGYAVQMPLSAAYGAEAHLRGLRPTSVFGVAGAAASAAVGLGLSVDQTTTAIALSLGAGGGVTRCMIEETDEWRLDLLRATRAGVESAHLAAHGAVSAALAFEGDKGWCIAMFGDPGASKLRRILDERTFALADVGLKPFPASGAGFATIDAALKAHAKLGGAWPDSLRLRVNPGDWSVPGSEARGPYVSILGAALSLPNLVASGYLHGTISPRATVGGDTELEDLIALVDAEPSDRLSAQEAELQIVSAGETHVFAGDGNALLKRFGYSAGETADDYASRFGSPSDKIAALFSLVENTRISAARILNIMGGDAAAHLVA